MKIVQRMAALASAIIVTGTLGMAAASSASASPVRATEGQAVSSTSSTALILKSAFAASRASAHRWGTVTISLTNASSFCVDVKDSVDHRGQTIWLYSCSGARDDKWIQVPATCNYVPSPCFAFEDAQNTSLCMNMPVADGYITLQPCSAQTSAWFISGGNDWLADSAWGGGIVATVASNVSGDPLFGEDLHHGWQQWHCTGGCAGGF